MECVARMNADRLHGYADWRVPARSELMSLFCYQENLSPAADGASIHQRGRLTWTPTPNEVRGDHARARY